MAIHHSTSISTPDISIRDVTREQIRAAFILHLPFRIRVGSLYRSRYDLENSIEICFKNLVAIPSGLEHPFPKGGLEPLWTDVLIIVERPDISEPQLEELRAGNEPKALTLSSSSFEAMNALNQWINAYSRVLGTLWGGKLLHLLTDIEFFDRLKWEITIYCPAASKFDDEDILKIFDIKADKEFLNVEQLTGDLFDLDTAQLDGVQNALRTQKEYIFYDFAFQAKTRMGARDFVGALLMAVIALEGAHAAFIRHTLSTRLQPDKEKDEVSRLINDLLREQGLYTLYQLTPFLLMEEYERPGGNILKECGKGIQIRNDIMHALTDNKGRYKLHKHKNIDLTQAYSSVLIVYNSYVTALEKRLRVGISSQSKN